MHWPCSESTNCSFLFPILLKMGIVNNNKTLSNPQLVKIQTNMTFTSFINNGEGFQTWLRKHAGRYKGQKIPHSFRPYN